MPPRIPRRSRVLVRALLQPPRVTRMGQADLPLCDPGHILEEHWSHRELGPRIVDREELAELVLQPQTLEEPLDQGAT